MKKDPEIDLYIVKSADFARPILEEIRFRVHQNCAEIEETKKWQFPHFLYKGKILCSMAAFKKHCSFGFWLASQMQSDYFKSGGMGDLGKMVKLEDLPSEEEFRDMILEAMSLIDAGKTLVKNENKSKKIQISKRLMQHLEENPEIESKFSKFSLSKQAEYHEWINEAKNELTIQKRILKTLEWVDEGKSRNWKYIQ